MNDQINPVNIKQVNPADKEKYKKKLILGGVLLVIAAILGEVGKNSTFCCVLSVLLDIPGWLLAILGGFGLFRFYEAKKVATAPTITLIATQMKGHIEIIKEWEEDVITGTVLTKEWDDEGSVFGESPKYTEEMVTKKTVLTQPLFIVDIDERDDLNSVIQQCEQSSGLSLNQWIDEKKGERIKINESYAVMGYIEEHPQTPVTYNVTKSIWEQFRANRRQVINTSLVDETRKYIKDSVNYT